MRQLRFVKGDTSTAREECEAQIEAVGETLLAPSQAPCRHRAIHSAPLFLSIHDLDEQGEFFYRKVPILYIAKH